MIFGVMTNTNSTPMAAAIDSRKLPTKTESSISNDGKWRTFKKHAGLMQYVPSGIYFARVKIKNGRNGVVKRASLETDVFSTAKDRLRAKINELRQPPAECGTFAEARLLYLADVDNDHALAAETKKYWNYRTEALVKTWPGLDGMKLTKIVRTVTPTPRHSLCWWSQGLLVALSALWPPRYVLLWFLIAYRLFAY